MRVALLTLLSILLLAGCGGSADELTGAPRGAEPASVVPADAALFIGAVTDSDSDAWQRVQQLLGRFPDGDRLLAEITKSIAAEGVDWERDVKPALGPVSAIVLPRGGSDVVAVTRPSLRAKLDALLGRSDRKVATASLEDGWVAISEKQATLDAYRNALDGPRLADDEEFGKAVGDLPEDALAAVFVRPSALNLSGLSGATGAPVPAAVPGSFRWAGAALTAADDGLAIEGTTELDDAPASYEPTLLRRVPGGVVLAISFHGDEEAFRKLADSQGLAPYLSTVQEMLGVRLQEVLDLLEGQGVLYVRPGLPIPEVTLAVETEDEAAAIGTIDRIARKLGGDVRATTVDGVETHSVRVTSVNIAWAVTDGVLLVSTGANALRDFRADDAKGVDEAAFGRAAEKVGLGDETTGFAYVDMRRVTELIEGLAGLAGEDLPPELRRNLEPIESFATNGAADGDGVRFRGFLSVPSR